MVVPTTIYLSPLHRTRTKRLLYFLRLPNSFLHSHVLPFSICPYITVEWNLGRTKGQGFLGNHDGEFNLNWHSLKTNYRNLCIRHICCILFDSTPVKVLVMTSRVGATSIQLNVDSNSIGLPYLTEPKRGK